MQQLRTLITQLHQQFQPLDTGEVASYIPQLAEMNPDWFAIAAVGIDGQSVVVGDVSQNFTIQSISKPFSFGLALDCHGPDKVSERVGVEPSGDTFNAIVLERDGGRPFNPMVNAGAIAVTDMIPGSSATDRLNRLLDSFRRYIGREDIYVDTPTFLSERTTGDRNRAMAYLMRAHAAGVPPEGPVTWALRDSEEPFARLEESLDLYFQQCSILVNCLDLATMAATLANDGVQPTTGVRAVSSRHIKRILSVMYTCGMYDSAGNWAYRVGIPAKSGVSGGIIGVVPGQLGIAVFSPRIDSQGNSVRGVKVFEALSQELGLHLFDGRRCTAAPLLDSAIRAS